MKTRGRGKTDGAPNDYTKDMIDPRDLGDDGDDTNGYYDDKVDDAVRARGNTRTSREGGNRRGGRVPRTVNMRSKADKNLIESAEFQDVVKGFIDFIEEIKKKKKPKGNKPLKPEESELGLVPTKRIKPDPLSVQPQGTGKSDLLEEDKSDKYSFNQDKNLHRGLLDIKKDNKKDTGIFTVQQPIDQAAKEREAKSKEPPIKQPAFGQNLLPSALPALNNAAKQQANPNKTLQSLYYDNPALFQTPDRFGFQNLTNLYTLPYGDNFSLNPNQLLNLQILESLLQQQRGQPNLLGSLLDPTQSAGGFYDLQRELQQYRAAQQLGLGNQRYGQQGLGAKLPEAEEANTKGFEGKLGRAATHVAIAYFIYFKSLDPESISRSDRTKMDPTYNARMLKEKRTEPYANEVPPMMNKQAPYYAGMEVENGYQPSVEFLERQIMEGQRLFRNPELNQALAAYQTQGKGDQKLEEEKVEAIKRKANEASKQAPKRQPREEEIIAIDENSDEEPKAKEQSVNQANKTEQVTKGEATKASEKAEEHSANVSAEDIVQKITELTGHSSGDGEKGENKRKNGKKPAGKAAEEGSKPAAQAPASQKVYAVAEEGKTPISHTPKNETKPEPKMIEVISSDEGPVVEEKPKEEKKEGQEKTEKMETEGTEEKDAVKTESTSVNPHATEDKEEKAASKTE